jgi:hypothetical protein
MKRKYLLALVAFVILSVVVALAQYRRNTQAHTARDIRSDTGEEPPSWTNAPAFQKDLFTFARVRYASSYTRAWRYGGGNWTTDAPDSDLNFSFRLQQLTSLLTDPDGRVVELTDLELFDFPWIYIVEPGWLEFSEAEVAALRKYLENGGFLMVDDFWGDAQWENFYQQIKRVFPNREPEDLEMDHPIFHCVFDIKLDKQQMQIPYFLLGEESQHTGITWEYRWGESAREVHFRAIFDDKRRMMAFIAHNTDNGDGWEREGIYKFYFREFSEKKAYPLGINVVFYAMTH